MELLQYSFSISRKDRGIHLITEEILKYLKDLADINKGLLNLHLMHTSAALSINENADPSVRSDMENFLERTVPEDMDLYSHTAEGPDDMTSHIKSSLFGANVSLPISNGKLNIGTWQGIYLCEFREGGKKRNITATIIGNRE